MIISKAGRYAILATLVTSGVHFSWQLPCVAADDSPPLLVRGVDNDAIHGDSKRRTLLRRDLKESRHDSRNIPIDCTSAEYQKRKKRCRRAAGCSWQKGGCVPALTTTTVSHSAIRRQSCIGLLLF